MVGRLGSVLAMLKQLILKAFQVGIPESALRLLIPRVDHMPA